MATGPEHYIEAERLEQQADTWMDADTGWKARLSTAERLAYRMADLAAAQVHATLALAEDPAQGQPVVKERADLTGESTRQPETSSERDEYIAGLRQFADWLEQHPDVEAPTVDRMLLPLNTNSAVEEFAAAHELAVTVDSSGNAEAVLHFGPVKYVAYGYADFKAFCEKRAEEQARRWAETNSMDLHPRQGGEAP
ncbi:hypothetical protein ACWCQW_10335 [Streptomyces mirabilis]